MKKYEIDMCKGPLLGKIVLFAMPLLATYALQLFFNAADLLIIGNYGNPNSMAAIGCTMSLNALVINIFIGLSVGTNVLIAKYLGAKDRKSIPKVVHTSFAIALGGGIALMIIGILIARPILKMLDTPANILDLASTYVWICFLGIPFILIYNFGCAILRGVGDTQRPLVILIFSGLANLILNLFFVIVCKMDVAGVALATVISHFISAVFIVRILVKSREDYRLNVKKIAIDSKFLWDILKIGLPASLQSSCFVFSNLLIQAAINSFGAFAMAGTTVVLALESFVYITAYAFQQTTISFVAQNLGGQKYKRIIKSIYICLGSSMAICALFAFVFLALGESILSVFNSDSEVIRWGMLRMKLLFPCYVICAVMEVVCGGLRGLNYSMSSTMTTLFSICVFRVWYVWAVLPKFESMECLLLSYPISWLLASIIGGVVFFYAYRKVLHSNCKIDTPWLGLRNPNIPKGNRFLGGVNQ